MIGNTEVRKALVATATLIGFVAFTANAYAFTQPPTAFPVTVDGQFTNASEYSDVTPVVFNSPIGLDYTYTAINSTKDALALFYDSPGSTTPYGTSISGPVEFNVGNAGPLQQHFQVYFTATGINVWRSIGSGSPVPFSVSCPNQVKGARFFGPSRNSAVAHNQHELLVSVQCSDATLNCITGCAGLYDELPEHWGATVATKPDSGHCVLTDSLCSQGVAASVNCATPGAVSVFGSAVSNACVQVIPGSGGQTSVTKVPLPGETTSSVPASSPATLIVLAIALLMGAGTAFSMRQRPSNG